MSETLSAEGRRKKVVVDYFRLVGQGRMQEGLRYFSPDCRQHNPYIAGGMPALTDSMLSAFKEGGTQYADPYFEVKHVLAEGDVAAAYTVLLGSRTKPGEGGLRQVHLFRFKGDKIVEYWDVTQMVTKDMPNAAGSF